MFAQSRMKGEDQKFKIVSIAGLDNINLKKTRI